VECEVEFTDEFSIWWEGLTEAEQVDVTPKSSFSRNSALAFLVLMPISFILLVIRT